MMDSGVGMDSLSAETKRDQADQWSDGSRVCGAALKQLPYISHG